MPRRPLALFVPLVFFSLPAAAQTPCWTGETQLTRDSKGVLSLRASQCHDVAVRSHFLGARGAFRSALTFENPNLTLKNDCGLTQSCLKYTAECLGTKWVTGAGSRPACKPESLVDPNEVSCACQAPDQHEFQQRLPVGSTELLQPAFLTDQNADGVFDNRRTDAWFHGGKNMRVYQLFRTLSRFELEDWRVAPDGDFNDYVAAVETRDCDPNRVWPPHTTDFGGPERPIRCVDSCGTNQCEKELVAPSQALRFAVALGIDDAKAEADREWRGRKLHLTVATHSDFAGDVLAVCPVLWLDWRRPRDPKETTDLTQWLNYGGVSSCGAWNGYKDSGVPVCPLGDTALMDALPISLSAYGTAAPCSATGALPEWFSAQAASKYNECGPRTHVRDYELPLADVDGRLVEPSLHYSNASAQELSDAVVAVELMVFRQLESRMIQWTSKPFSCPSGVNAVLRGAPSTVAQVTSYRFNPPTRPGATPGFTLYVRQ